MTILQSRFCRATLSGRLAALLVLIVLAPVAGAQGNDPAAAPIVRLNGTLLEVMQQAKQLGVKGRYDKLAPVLTKTYDIASMAKVAAGPSWDSFTPQQKSAVINAFSRMMIATYASRFDGFSGEKLEVVQTLDQPPSDKLVKTRIVQSNGKPIALNYVMRASGPDWKVVDVYLDGTISELATRRAEFGSILKTGGPDALVAALTKQSDKLLGGA